MKWTPGPWSVNRDAKIHLVVLDAKGNVVGEAALGGRTREESSANASVMAAAPDLYEALADVMKCVDAGALVRNTSRDHEHGWAVHQLPIILSLKAAQAALAKARGETK